MLAREKRRMTTSTSSIASGPSSPLPLCLHQQCCHTHTEALTLLVPYGKQPAGPLLLLHATPAMVPDVAPDAVLSDGSDGDTTK